MLTMKIVCMWGEDDDSGDEDTACVQNWQG
jgi:hypothetical protein